MSLLCMECWDFTRHVFIIVLLDMSLLLFWLSITIKFGSHNITEKFMKRIINSNHFLNHIGKKGEDLLLVFLLLAIIANDYGIAKLNTL